MLTELNTCKDNKLKPTLAALIFFICDMARLCSTSFSVGGSALLKGENEQYILMDFL